MMQLNGLSAVTTDIYSQVLLSSLAVEKDFRRNKHAFKLLQALGLQFWLQSSVAKWVLLPAWDSHMQHAALTGKSSWKCFVFPKEDKQAATLCRTDQTSWWDLWSDRMRPWTLQVLNWTFLKGNLREHSFPVHWVLTFSCLIFWYVLPSLCGVAVFPFQEHAVVDLRL